MKIDFLKKIKEYLFVRHITDYSFAVGKLGYCSHTKNERINLGTIHLLSMKTV